MKEQCRICSGDLCGNQRRWIFHPASRPNLQLLLSHALGRGLCRDGRGEFACSKCAFVLERMYRFDMVIVRVEALSVERLQRLLEERERLRQHVSALYRRSNGGMAEAAEGAVGAAQLSYSALLQEDLANSGFESWARQGVKGKGVEVVQHRCGMAETAGQRPRNCRGCAGLRVADSDYEAVCRRPRRAGRSVSCGPATCMLASKCGEEPVGIDQTQETPHTASDGHTTPEEGGLSQNSSVESLDVIVDVGRTTSGEGKGDPKEESELEDLEALLTPARRCRYRPVPSQRGSRLPVLAKPASLEASTKTPCRGPQPREWLELAELEESWQDVYMEYMPFQEQTLIDQQQTQLNQYERAASQCVDELQKVQLQAQSLQAKIQESEATNQRLRDKLSDMEAELQSLRQEPQLQDCVIQSPRESLHIMDVELDPEGAEPGQVTLLQSELLTLRGSLFSAQLELQGTQRASKQAEQRAADLASLLEHIQVDLKEALRRREAAELHNQELRSALQQARSAVQEKEAQLKEQEAGAQMEVEGRDRSIHTLRMSLHKKEELLQEYSDLLDSTREPTVFRDALLDKLKDRIKERDRALERAIDEKFHCLEEKDREAQRLHVALREKDRDMERLRCVLSGNEETITSLDGLLRAKQLELDRVTEASRSLQWLKQEAEKRHGRSLAESEALIGQLQASLEKRSEEAEELTTALLGKLSTNHSQVVEELGRHLRLKDRLFREVLSDRNRLAQERQTEVQELLNTISARDQYIQDSAARLRQVISEGAAEVRELRWQLAANERRGLEAEILRERLREKEAVIQQLMLNHVEPMVASNQGEAVEESCDHDSEARNNLQALQEELHLALKKEKETQLELLALRSALATRMGEKPPEEGDLDTPTQSVRLSKILSEYDALNEALKTEKEIYHNLIQIQPRKGSPEKTHAIDVELEAVQNLRGQLEGVLVRTRDTALALEEAAKMQPDFGELSTEEAQEEDERSEFTDSIEDVDDCVLTAVALTTTQNAVLTHELGDQRGGLMNGMLSQDSAMGGQGLAEWKREMEQLVEQKRTVERELGELKTQLEKCGFTSLSQMRAALLGLRQENEELRVLSGKAKRWGSEKCAAERWSEEGRGIREEEDGEEEDVREQTKGNPTQGKRCAPRVQLRRGRGKRQCTRPHSLDLGALLSQGPVESTAQGAEPSVAEGGFWQQVEVGLREQVQRLRTDLTLSRQESRELQERLMVSEATVLAQSEQLKDYRELLSETSVEQHSKQVQVDLQDLGYETSCRSENEAEREDMSSPEFDGLEMCPDPPQQDHGAQWWAGDCGKCEEAEELRTQLSRAHRTIRGLQARVRSLSTTSDYASSLERPRRKVDWAFQASPTLGGPEEDEGWQSDGPAPSKRGPGRELEELGTRVALLESQLKNKNIMEDVKSATWPGKYGTLIQAQARELSHLRQRMREGCGVCHALALHLDDTTKAFEELLRANDVDYYMGQSFREQLAESQALASRVKAKICGRGDLDLQVDKMGPKLLSLRLRKELQQKDDIIESLHSKLRRTDTPSSCHAPSETTDQSDGTSFASSERGSTNEDLEVGSDVDLASECGREERVRQSRPGTSSTETTPCGGSMTWHPCIPSSASPSHEAQSSNSCTSMPCSQFMPVENQDEGRYCGPISSSLPIPQSQYYPNPRGQSGNAPFDPHSPLQGVGLFSLADAHQELQMLQKQLGESFSLSHPNPLPGFHPVPQSHLEPTSYMPMSHNAFPPASFGVPDGTPTLNVFTNLLESSASWDTGHVQGGGCVSASPDPSGLLREIRGLRQQLEDSIRANERLRHQLEERLATASRDGAPTNIYIQGLESLTPLANEIRALKEENLALQAQLQASRDACQEAEKLQAMLKEAELEAEQWKEELQRLQVHSCDQALEMQRLQLEQEVSQERIKRLQHEAYLLQQQLTETQQLVDSLRCELAFYDRMCRSTTWPPAAYRGRGCPAGAPAAADLADLLDEMRRLRTQLESSYKENGKLRAQLLQQPGSPGGHGESHLSGYGKHFSHDLALSPPVRDTGPCDAPPPSASEYTEAGSSELAAYDLEPRSLLEGDASDGSCASKSGHHAVGHVGDFSALRQQILEGKVLVQDIEAVLQCSLKCTLPGPAGTQALDHSDLRGLLGNTRTLRQILEESSSLLRMFWRAALPSSEDSAQQAKKDQSMRNEIQQLHQRIRDQEEALQGTTERLRSSNRSKENMEHFIVSQLSRTRSVLKKARTNLEKNEYKLSALSSSSSSPDPGKAEGARIPWEARRSDCGSVTYRPLQAVSQQVVRKRTGQRFLPVAAH
ncbi:myomegalin-like isoform X2 [Brienomyrus brachyistius]|uniref:myomegalin-like isoform X2 n=1 Tax=Brienomyrus brachyistius TaxID=42636 RepID=UPI0020B21A61|nr:myomegalin-like isoform X2 [Brienomyrus brachyistius]